MKTIGLMMLTYGGAILTYTFLSPGDQFWQSAVGGGLIGLGAALASD